MCKIHMQNLKSHFWRDFFAYYTRPVNVHLAMVCVGCLFSNFSVFLLCFTQHKITWNLCFPVSIFQYGHMSYPPSKIQGDGQKFLDRFKLFWVTNIITIIKRGPYLPITAKIHNKRWGFVCVCVCVCVFVSSWCHELQMANDADEMLLGERPH